MTWSWLHDPHSEWWNVANVLGTWFAVIGSIATAAIALWLAYRDRLVVLQLIATIGNPRDGVTEGEVILQINNLGRRSVLLDAIGFSTGAFPWWSPILPNVNDAPLQPALKLPTSVIADGERYQTTERCLGMEVGFSLRAEHVVAAMNRL